MLCSSRSTGFWCYIARYWLIAQEDVHRSLSASARHWSVLQTGSPPSFPQTLPSHVPLHVRGAELPEQLPAAGSHGGGAANGAEEQRAPPRKRTIGTPRADDRHRASSSPSGSLPLVVLQVDVMTEMQKQLQAAVQRCNPAGDEVGQGVRGTTVAREQREELLLSSAQAEAASQEARKLPG